MARSAHTTRPTTPTVRRRTSRALLLASAALLGAPIATQAAELPLKRVVLSTSGLAQFTHGGKIIGGSSVDLPVRLDQVDDILKSLTVFDALGAVGTVSLPGREPLDELFRDLPFDRAALESPQDLINALVGADVMPEGVTPTTSVINQLRYGPEPTVTMLADGIILREHPADFLDEITVVDTPGTNAIIREHEALTQQFVPRSDLVLFVTSADRPFTESEREFMGTIRDWGKKIVIVINKIDAENLDLPGLVADIRERFGRQCMLLDLPAHGAADVVEVLEHDAGDADFA